MTEIKSRVYYKADKAKIRELENDIAEMKLDHEKTFKSVGINTSVKSDEVSISRRFVQMLVFVAGVILLGAGLWNICSVFSIKSGFATLMLGNLRIAHGISCIPSVIGVILLLIFKKTWFSVTLTSVGAVIIALGIMSELGLISAGKSTSGTFWTMVFILLICAGTAMLALAIAKLRIFRI